MGFIYIKLSIWTVLKWDQTALLLWQQLFFQDHHKIHPIARPLAQAKGCLLWVQTFIWLILEPRQWCVHCHTILYRIITVPDSISTVYMFKFLAWSPIVQSVCQRAFSMLVIRFQRRSGFESCIQQRKTSRLLSIQKSLASARASKLTITKIYITRTRCECQPAVGSSGLNAFWSQGRAVEFKILACSPKAQWVCQRAFSMLEMQHSAEEDNVSPFDSKIACLCESI